MRFGIQLPNTGPQATPAFMTEIAELGDELGFSSLFLSDHVVVPRQIASRYPYNADGVFASSPDSVYYEPLNLLAYLAGRTRRIRLGVSVLVVPYRNPVLVAKMLADLDALSHGRVVLGIGIGWMEEEFRALSAGPFEQRGALTDEYVRLYRSLWREDAPSFAGTFYQLAPIGMFPKPAQAAIPILVGGNSRSALRRAARLGDGWHPIRLSHEQLASLLAVLRQYLMESGRAPDGFPVVLRQGLRLTSRSAARRPGEQAERAFVGTPDEVAAQLEPYHQLGVSEVVAEFRECNADELRETMRLCARELAPRFVAP